MSEQSEQNAWVVRTGFSDQNKWEHIRELISSPQKDGGNEFFAYVKFVDHENYRDKDAKNLVLALPDSYVYKFCFIVDQECITNQEHPILVVGFYPSDNESFDRLPRNTPLSDIATFRALPSQIQGIENNLSIGNMDFEDFADSVDEDGVFRGFPRT